MKRLFRYRNGRILLRYNEAVMENKTHHEIVTKEFNHKTKMSYERFTLGIELAIHTGGRICYGMLEADIQPNERADMISVSLDVTSKNSERYTESLMGEVNSVYKGLPEEYAEAIINSIDSVISNSEFFPQCRISFENAANCEVGSSPYIFGCIAEVMMLILASDQAIEQILEMNIEDFTHYYAGNIRRLHV